MTEHQSRRPNFGMLLRRSKSGDFNKGARKAQALKEAELERQRQVAMRVPPKLPEFANNTEQLSKALPQELQQPSQPTYSHKNPDSGGYYVRASTEPHDYVATGAPPMPPIPNMMFDPYARSESMANRSRYSYASTAVSTINSPRRVRRRKDPTPFNILVIGTSGAGKTSFLEFLKTALALPPKKRTRKRDEDDFRLPPPASGNFIPHYMETEIDNERIGLTLWDSEGLEKNVVDLQLRELTAFLESKFEETFAEEMKVVRSPGVQDSHIHAVFLVLDPARIDRSLAAFRQRANGSRGYGSRNHWSVPMDDDLSLQVLRSLHQKTTVIPVIAKADTITTRHMNVLKRFVWNSIKQADLDPLEALGLDDDTESIGNNKIEEEGEGEEEEISVDQNERQKSTSSSPPSPKPKRLSGQSIRRHKIAQEDNKEEEVPFLPFSILSPDLYEPAAIGRRFPWGFADPYNDEHCDFTRLKEAVFSDWRGELREASRDQWYEGWRTNRLKSRDLPFRCR
ncbi:hypothetical protein E4U43_007861 [Claviceps pusilla]|uniref:Septin-type G domain-containing protein n=1 Tax=Claviceps pusilla TaxID=123648 RepID=A0A9P7NBS3_9HYPO|nr:hypothetical protein E4U43_007861 [Claviceps pusilla]